MVACSGIPLVIQLMSPVLRYEDYTLLQITNPFWSMGHVVDSSNIPVETYVLIPVISLAAAAIFFANIPAIVAELRYKRIAPPERVQREDAAIAAEREGPTSPWDERPS